MQTGERMNLSTFGAVGDESEAGTLYSTVEWSDFISGNLGGNAESFRPIFYGMGGFLMLCF